MKTEKRSRALAHAFPLGEQRETLGRLVATTPIVKKQAHLISMATSGKPRVHVLVQGRLGAYKSARLLISCR